MATTTAVILVGSAHQNDSGINPTHIIQFRENSRASLVLQSFEGKKESQVVIPTIENTIEDIYLMIAVYILKEIHPSKDLQNSNRDSLYEIFSQEERYLLYDETFKVFERIRVKVVFNILDGSLLLDQVETIKKYPNDFEVTLPAMKKEFNSWSNEILTNGL